MLDPTNLALGFAAPIAVGLNATARAATIRAVGGITRNYGLSVALLLVPVKQR